MKKLLLFVCFGIFAMSVNAQEQAKTKVASTKKLQYELASNMKMAAAISTEAFNKANGFNAAKAPEMDKVAGNYIEDNYLDIHECSAATITAMDGNKVKIAFSTGYAEIEGTYDPATGVITCGAQECGSYTNTSTGVKFDFTIFGISELDLDQGKLSITEDLSFTVADDGTISIDQLGYFLRISGCTEASYIGQTWSWYAATKFMPVNATQAGFSNIGTGWNEYAIPVSVEDFEFSVNVYNFCEEGCLSIDINDDGTVSAATGQPTRELILRDETEYPTYGHYINFTGVEVTSDGKIRRDYNKTAVLGTIKGNTITLDEYFTLASNADADGAAYADGWYADGTTITLTEGNYIASGIEEVTITREEKIKNTKTYNIMGQQVDRSKAKGLLIRDGKKYIKK